MEQQDKYQMIIHTKGGPIGHVAVEIAGPGINDDKRYIRGFAPKKGYEIEAGLTLEVPGYIRDDLKNVKDKDQGYIAGPAQDLTQKGAFAVKGYFGSLMGKDLTYDSNDDKHCVTKANEAVIASGFKGNLYNALSTEQKEAMNVANVYGTFAYDNPITKSLKDLSNRQAGQTRTLNRDAITKATKAELERRGIDFVSEQNLVTITKVTLDQFAKPMENGLINQVSPDVLGGYIVDAIEATAPVLGQTRFQVKKDKIENSVAQSIANTPQAQTNTPTAPQQNQVANTATQTPSPTANRTVTIKAGDTLSQLAQTHDTTVDALMNLNPQITNKHEIYINEKISVPAPSAPRPLRAAPLPPRKPSPPSLLTNNHNLSVLNIPDKAAPATITGVPKNAWMTNAPLTKTPRNKGFEAGLVGLGMTPKEAKEALANYSLGPGNSIGPAPKQLQQPAQPQPSLGMFQNKQQLEKSVRQNQGPTVDAKAYLDAAVYGRSRLDSIMNPDPTTPRRATAISAEEGASQAAAVGAEMTNADMQKVIKTRLMGNLVAQDKSYLFDVEKGYFSEQERVKEARLAEMGRLQDQTNKTIADRVKEADIKAARLATNTMPTMKIGKPNISVDLSQFTSTKQKQETLGQESFLGAKDESLGFKGVTNSFLDPSQNADNIDRVREALSTAQNARRAREKNLPLKDKSLLTMTPKELSRRGTLDDRARRGLAVGRNKFGWSEDDPTTAFNEAGFDTFGHMIDAAGAALSSGWYGPPSRNPHTAPAPQKKDKDGDGASKGGGTVICTELYHQDLLPLDVYMADQRYGLRLERDDPYVIVGYHFWAKPVVRLMQRSKVFTHVLNKTLAEPWAKEMVVKEGGNGIGTVRGKILFALGLPVCRGIGRMLAACKGREGKAA